jgi:hypothetical protein
MFPEELNELQRYFIFDTNLDNSIDICNISDDIKLLFRRLIQLKLEILSHFQFFRSLSN